MKPLKIFSALLILLSCHICHAQNWEQWYGYEDLKVTNRGALEHYDYGYLILGRIDTIDYINTKSYLIKTTVNGNPLWTKTLSGLDNVIMHNCANSLDGGTILCGNLYFEDIRLPFVIKLNACGEKEWCTAIELNELVPAAIDVVEDNDGNFGLAVYSSISGEKTHLYKLNSEGELLWKTKVCSEINYPHSRSPKPEAIIATISGDFLIVGDVYWKNPDDDLFPLRPMIALIDKNGVEKWVKPFGVEEGIYGDATNVLQISSNYFIVTGSRWIGDNKEGLIMSFDSLGNQIDYRIIEPIEIDTSYEMLVFMSIQYIDDHFFFHAYAGDEDAGSPVAVIKTNNDLFGEGFEVLDVLQHENGRAPISDLLRTSDNKILSASTDRYTFDDYKIYLTKLNADLEYDSICTEPYEYDYLCNHPIESGTIYLDDCNIIVETEEILTPKEYLEQKVHVQIVPNPAKGEISLSFENTERFDGLVLRITSVLGQQVYKTNLIKGQSELNLNGLEWQKGVYLAQLYSRGRLIGNNRFIKM